MWGIEWVWLWAAIGHQGAAGALQGVAVRGCGAQCGCCRGVQRAALLWGLIWVKLVWVRVG